MKVLVMKVFLGLVLGVIIVFLSVPACPCMTPTVELDTVSIGTVQYGTMPVHARGSGAVSRIGVDSRVAVQVLRPFVRFLKAGQPAFVKISGSAGTLTAKVIRIGQVDANGQASLLLSFSQPLPPEVRAGDSADALIDCGRIENTLYVDIGALNAENADATVFRINPDKTATRVIVRFGVITSELAEIKSGLRKGDKVIVTDMSRYDGSDRIRLE